MVAPQPKKFTAIGLEETRKGAKVFFLHIHGTNNPEEAASIITRAWPYEVTYKLFDGHLLPLDGSQPLNLNRNGDISVPQSVVDRLLPAAQSAAPVSHAFAAASYAANTVPAAPVQATTQARRPRPR